MITVKGVVSEENLFIKWVQRFIRSWKCSLIVFFKSNLT